MQREQMEREQMEREQRVRRAAERSRTRSLSRIGNVAYQVDLSQLAKSLRLSAHNGDVRGALLLLLLLL